MSSTDPDLKPIEANKPVAIDVVNGHLVIERYDGTEEVVSIGGDGFLSKGYAVEFGFEASVDSAVTDADAEIGTSNGHWGQGSINNVTIYPPDYPTSPSINYVVPDDIVLDDHQNFHFPNVLWAAISSQSVFIAGLLQAGIYSAYLSAWFGDTENIDAEVNSDVGIRGIYLGMGSTASDTTSLVKEENVRARPTDATPIQFSFEFVVYDNDILDGQIADYVMPMPIQINPFQSSGVNAMPCNGSIRVRKTA